MTFLFADRVKETVSNKPNASTAFNLSGAVTGGVSFVSGIGDGNTCMYCAQAVDATGALESLWEIGVGTVNNSTPDTVTRNHYISGSSGSLVDFSSATAIEIFVVDPASQISASGGVLNNLAAGIYHYPIYPEGNLTARATGANAEQLYYPLLITRPCIITSMAIDVLTAGSAGHRARMGIHEANNGNPSTLRFEAGTVLTDTVAFKQITGLSHFIPPGKYFLTLQTELNIAKMLGIGGQTSVGLWNGFGVRPGDRDYNEGVISEYGNGTGSFGSAMWDAGTELGLVRRPTDRALLMYKFEEV